MLMLGGVLGVLVQLCSPLFYSRNCAPGYPQICPALVILEVFVLKNNWKDNRAAEPSP